jgi:predicted RNA-binding protein with TRAM domain
MLIGPGAEGLKEIERITKRTFLLEGEDGTPLDHFTVLDKGTVEKLMPESPFKEGQQLDVKLGEVGLHDSDAGMGKLDGYEVCVGGAARLVGKKVKIRVERVMDGTVYASLVGAAAATGPAPITAEGLAEKPTRGATRKGIEPELAPAPDAVETEAEAVTEEAPSEAEPEEPRAETEAETEGETEIDTEAPAKKKTRRGSRGGRRRRKPGTPSAVANGSEEGAAEAAAVEEPEQDAVAPRIHLPDPSLGAEGEDEASENGAQPARRRRSRSRRRPTAAGTATNGDAAAEAEEPETASEPEAVGETEAEAPKRRKTRRGSRGGRRRKKAPATAAEGSSES